MGIGHTKPYALCGISGSRFHQTEWGYPTWGPCICTMPSAGHDMIMLDYRDTGPEPRVIHVDQESNYREVVLAETFADFVTELVPEEEYEPAWDADRQAQLDNKLLYIDHGKFSSTLAPLIARATELDWDRVLRLKLRQIAVAKGHFNLHGDPESEAVYDILFLLAQRGGKIRDGAVFDELYRKMLAFGDTQITLGGYARGFLEQWLEKRRAAGDIIGKKSLTPTPAFTERIIEHARALLAAP